MLEGLRHYGAKFRKLDERYETMSRAELIEEHSILTAALAQAGIEIMGFQHRVVALTAELAPWLEIKRQAWARGQLKNARIEDRKNSLM